ncbi:MAG: FecR family protein [Gammaproteobacteria bacterium]|nr:FecR family protein [Gammaproteobacteria bacterium]
MNISCWICSSGGLRRVLAAGLWTVAAMSAPVSAAESIGTVRYADGVASVEAADRSGDLVKGSPLYVGDLIRTGAGARLGLELSDGSVIRLGADTEFRVQDYRYVADPAGGYAVFALARGAFRALTGVLGKLDQPAFRVNTPVAAVGVRGTEFWGGFHFSRALDVAVLAGKGVWVENPAGRVEISGAGFGTTVRDGNTPPSEPKAWPAEKLGAAAKATARKN